MGGNDFNGSSRLDLGVDYFCLDSGIMRHFVSSESAEKFNKKIVDMVDLVVDYWQSRRPHWSTMC